MINAYKTVLRREQATYIVSKSRFIGYASPCESEEDALSFLDDIRQKHKDASHHCYAYIVGQNAGIMRYNDDGEPSGTAGMPIIEVMKAQSLVNLGVVVVRYFGGVLLGAGGLVRAYSHTCAEALKAAHVVTMEATERIWCEIDYSTWDKLRYQLAKLPVLLEESSFSASVNFTILSRVSQTQETLRMLNTLTNGTMESIVADTFFHPWE